MEIGNKKAMCGESLENEPVKTNKYSVQSQLDKFPKMNVRINRDPNNTLLLNTTSDKCHQ